MGVYSYPPPDQQLAMAMDIVKTFPEQASSSGKGHVSNNCFILVFLCFFKYYSIACLVLAVADWRIEISRRNYIQLLYCVQRITFQYF